MKTLEDIKQERAYEMDYSDWEEFIYSVDDPNILDTEFDEVANRFTKEVAREALKNAAENAKLVEEDNDIYYPGLGLQSEKDFSVDKQTILSDKNIPEI